MNRTRLLFIGVLALALGGLLSSAVYRTLKSSTNKSSGPEVDVAVAANDIPVGTKIGDGDVKIVKMLGTELPPGVFHTKSKIVNHGAVVSIGKGEFILPSKIAGENAGSGLPSLIPAGFRAVSVRVNEVIGVAGFVTPGTRVDVLLTGTPPGGNVAVTTTVLQNVLVLASGQKLERSTSGEAQNAQVVTLQVTPEESQKLTLASQEGKIQLALRNPVDTKEDKVASTPTFDIYGAVAPRPTTAKPVVRHAVSKPQGPPPAPSVYKVEVIRGDKKEEKAF
jgi:pilus assembly protein CpaB